MRLEQYLENPDILQRYRKIKPYFKFKESLYEVTNKCQLRCQGCYYFTGSKHEVTAIEQVQSWLETFRLESKRGVTFANIAGAEPSLVPSILSAVASQIKHGVIYTNGLKVIPEDIPYMIHISIWGNDETDELYRGANCLTRQLKNYKDDPRAVFVYTFNKHNIDDVDGVIDKVISNGNSIAFNFFSSTFEGDNELKFDKEALLKLRNKLLYIAELKSPSVLVTPYLVEVHTNSEGLYNQFGCPYPRKAKIKSFGVGSTFKNIRADLTEVYDSCCNPDIDCNDCRSYAAGSVILSSAMPKHIQDEAKFRGWLDYVDCYLATFFPNYIMDEPLYV